MLRACQAGDVGSAQRVLSNHPTVEIVEDEGGNTAIHHACRLGLSMVAQDLVSLGFDPHKFNRKGQTALDLANDAVARSVKAKYGVSRSSEPLRRAPAPEQAPAPAPRSSSRKKSLAKFAVGDRVMFLEENVETTVRAINDAVMPPRYEIVVEGETLEAKASQLRKLGPVLVTAFEKNERVLYERHGQRLVATIVDVDRTIDPPAYVILVDDGGERSVEGSSLRKLASDDPPPSYDYATARDLPQSPPSSPSSRRGAGSASSHQEGGDPAASSILPEEVQKQLWEMRDRFHRHAEMIERRATADAAWARKAEALRVLTSKHECVKRYHEHVVQSLLALYNAGMVVHSGKVDCNQQSWGALAAGAFVKAALKACKLPIIGVVNDIVGDALDGVIKHVDRQKFNTQLARFRHLGIKPSDVELVVDDVALALTDLFCDDLASERKFPDQLAKEHIQLIIRAVTVDDIFADDSEDDPASAILAEFGCGCYGNLTNGPPPPEVIPGFENSVLAAKMAELQAKLQALETREDGRIDRKDLDDLKSKVGTLESRVAKTTTTTTAVGGGGLTQCQINRADEAAAQAATTVDRQHVAALQAQIELLTQKLSEVAEEVASRPATLPQKKKSWWHPPSRSGSKSK